MSMRSRLVLLCLLGVLVSGASDAGAQDMPAPEMVHGKALAQSNLPDGTVTVRIARESIGNWLSGQTVRVQVDGRTVSARTDDQGRAEFRSLTRDAELRAEATVDGEALVSEPFRVPSSGGLRVILIAGIAQAAERRKAEEAAALAAPPVKGVISLGGDTRIVAEFQNDALFVFYQLDIVNTARAPVDIGGPFELTLPQRAAGASLLEGAPKTASIDGRYVEVQGPFAPGITTVNVQFQLRYSGPELTIEQQFPVAVQQLPFFIERLGNLTVTSPQMRPDGERAGANGSAFAALTSSSSLPAGATVSLELKNLPAQSRVAAYISVGLALLTIAIGVWLSVGARRTDLHATLISRRDALLSRLEELEIKRRNGKMADERYLSRRQRLIADLEDTYHEIDLAGGRSQGGDEGVAA
jgi:hypothetical protein